MWDKIATGWADEEDLDESTKKKKYTGERSTNSSRSFLSRMKLSRNNRQKRVKGSEDDQIKRQDTRDITIHTRSEGPTVQLVRWQ